MKESHVLGLRGVDEKEEAYQRRHTRGDKGGKRNKEDSVEKAEEKAGEDRKATIYPAFICGFYCISLSLIGYLLSYDTVCMHVRMVSGH